MVKVRLRGSDEKDVETLWATQVGLNQYRLENSPFFAYGVSWQDIVEATPKADGVPEFVRCLEKSGNRTLRVFFEQYSVDDPLAESILRGLRVMGASYEGMPPKMISVNVPPRKDLDEVTEFLTERQGIKWEYADPTYDEIMSGRVPHP